MLKKIYALSNRMINGLNHDKFFMGLFLKSISFCYKQINKYVALTLLITYLHSFLKKMFINSIANNKMSCNEKFNLLLKEH